MNWLYQTDACSLGFMEYMPCIYVSCYARLMRVPTGSRSICNMLCLRYARLMRVPTGSRSIYVMSVSRRGSRPRSMSQLCNLLSIFILTLSMFSFSGKERDISASDRRISSDHGQGTSHTASAENHSLVVLFYFIFIFLNIFRDLALKNIC